MCCYKFAQLVRSWAVSPIAPAAMSQYSHYSQPDPDFLRFKAARPRLSQPSGAESDKDVIETIRQRAIDTWVPQNTAAFERHLPVGKSVFSTSSDGPHAQRRVDSIYRVQDHAVAVEGGDITIRVVIPSDFTEETFPMLVYIHGGGWFAGNIDACDYECRVLATKTKAVTVNVGYRCAYEFACVTTSLNVQCPEPTRFRNALTIAMLL